MFNLIYIVMKIFKATIEAENNAYVKTVLIIDENERKAHEQLCKYEKRNVKYTSELVEITIYLYKPNIIDFVGFGVADHDYYYDD